MGCFYLDRLHSSEYLFTRVPEEYSGANLANDRCTLFTNRAREDIPLLSGLTPVRTVTYRKNHLME